jgi:thymidylate synthase
MKPYLELLKDIRDNGHDHPDRTGKGRRSIFGRQIRFSMADGFPLVTTRKIFFRGMKEELFWFIQGNTNTKTLNEAGVHIWDKWAVNDETVETFLTMLKDKEFISKDENSLLLESMRSRLKTVNGSIGEMYGFHWRHAESLPDSNAAAAVREDIALSDIPSDKLEAFRVTYRDNKETAEAELKASGEERILLTEDEFVRAMYASKTDQLGILLAELKNNPFSSRLVVSVWMPSLIPDSRYSPGVNVLMGRGALAPCHVMFQCFVRPDTDPEKRPKLSLMMTQRSVDTPVGACFNIAQYSLLLHLIARHVNMQPDEFIWSTGDTHIYLDQLELVDEQLSREPFKLPTLKFNTEETDLFKIDPKDIEIIDYISHPNIPYPIAI